MVGLRDELNSEGGNRTGERGRHTQRQVQIKSCYLSCYASASEKNWFDLNWARYNILLHSLPDRPKMTVAPMDHRHSQRTSNTLPMGNDFVPTTIFWQFQMQAKRTNGMPTTNFSHFHLHSNQDVWFVGMFATNTFARTSHARTQWRIDMFRDLMLFQIFSLLQRYLFVWRFQFASSSSSSSSSSACGRHGCGLRETRDDDN